MNIVTNNKSTNKTTVLKNRKIEWIVLHYTAGTSSIKGKATAIANYFKTSSAQASADYVIDDESIVLYNADIKNRYTWAVGGKKYTTKSTSEAAKYYGQCTNKNSINIEMCSTKSNTKSLSASDTDWYITDKVFNNAVELVNDLMKEYGIDKSHVIMHHHVTGKVCPNPWCVNETRLVIYHNFINKLNGENEDDNRDNSGNSTDGNNSSVEFKIKVTAQTLNIRSGPGVNYTIKGTITDKGVYTIVDEQNNFGKLKSGQGWVSLKYTEKI